MSLSACVQPASKRAAVSVSPPLTESSSRAITLLMDLFTSSCPSPGPLCCSPLILLDYDDSTSLRSASAAVSCSAVSSHLTAHDAVAVASGPHALVSRFNMHPLRTPTPLRPSITQPSPPRAE